MRSDPGALMHSDSNTEPNPVACLAHAHCLCTNSRAALSATDKFREQRFDGVDEEEDRPLIAQFCGNDPDTVVRLPRCSMATRAVGDRCPYDMVLEQHHSCRSTTARATLYECGTLALFCL